jgi:murein DD-endopeptidase MepM/ murein hydrolase activator NlpD
MGRIVFLFIILFLCLPFKGFSASYPLASKTKNTIAKIDQKKIKVNQIEKQMKQLEETLNSKNAELESYSTKLSDAHEKIDLLKSEAKPMLGELSKLESDLMKMVKKYVLNKLDDEETPANLYTQKMMIQLISLDIEKLRLKKIENESSDKQIKEAEENLISLLKTKETLQALLAEMKGKKEALAFDLDTAKQAPVITPTPQPKLPQVVPPKAKALTVSKIPPKTSSNDEILSINTDEGVKDSAPQTIFSSPIKNFIEISNSSKGVTFTFSEVSQVVAPGAGEVVFAGELSTYGNVVMIDHGGEIRTVLLGNFLPKVSKHDKIGAGDLIGYTEVISNKKNTLYFEVRKKNVAQNTVRYLNKNLLKSRL